MPKSKSKAAADDRYNKKTYEQVKLSFRKDAEINGDFIRSYAKNRGESINGFLLRAVIETVKRDTEKMS